MATNEELYKSIGEKLGKIIEESFEKPENDELFSQVSSFYDDYERWLGLIADYHKEKLIYDEALSNYMVMLLLMSEGLYKNAYMLLRGYLEFTLFGVRVSSNDLEFRKWTLGDRTADVKWSKITDENEGIFSKQYVSVYNPRFVEDANVIRSMAIVLYRECSEYIHNGYSICKNFDVKYDEHTFKKMCETIKKINKVILFAFCIRYEDEIFAESDDTVIDCIRENLNEFESIRKMLGE